MAKIRTSIFVASAIFLAACSSNPFESGSDTVGQSDFAAASDPSSPAFFNQTIGDRVFFEVDQSVLTAEGRALLSEQANWLATNADFTAIIEGHADEQGTREYNLALGARRASAVQDFLVSRGVAPGRLRTVTFGKERPVSLCSDETCYSQNRRSVTVISAGGLS